MNYDNLLFVVMDSCRYDTFIQAKTPNFDKVGETYKVYSPTAGTLETFLVYLYGQPPFGLPDSMIESGYWKDYRDPRCIIKYKRPGYTSIFTANKALMQLINLFPGKFDDTVFNQFTRPGAPVSLSCKGIFEEFIHRVKDKDKFHSFLWMMETHHPYSTSGNLPYNHIMEHDMWFNNQKQAIEYIDQEFKVLLDYLESRDDKTLVYILSDHGDMMGEEVDGRKRWHHSVFNPQLRVTFHEKLFEIPYIEGVI